MSIRKLHPERAVDEAGLLAGIAVNYQSNDLARAVISSRAFGSLGAPAAAYPIHRAHRLAIRRKLEDVFDDLALQLGLVAIRINEYAMVLDGPGVFIQVVGRRKLDYCSCWFNVWADSRQRVEDLQHATERIVGECYRRDQ